MAAPVADALQVAIVVADRLVWEGAASGIIVRTTEGDMGILPGHEPLFSVLIPGVVQVRTDSTGELITDGLLRVAIDGGFVSVADDRVSVLAEDVVLPAEVDPDEQRHLLSAAEHAGDHPAAAQARARLALAEGR